MLPMKKSLTAVQMAPSTKRTHEEDAESERAASPRQKFAKQSNNLNNEHERAIQQINAKVASDASPIHQLPFSQETALDLGGTADGPANASFSRDEERISFKWPAFRTLEYRILRFDHCIDDIHAVLNNEPGIEATFPGKYGFELDRGNGRTSGCSIIIQRGIMEYMNLNASFRTKFNALEALTKIGLHMMRDRSPESIKALDGVLPRSLMKCMIEILGYLDRNGKDVVWDELLLDFHAMESEDQDGKYFGTSSKWYFQNGLALSTIIDMFRPTGEGPVADPAARPKPPAKKSAKISKSPGFLAINSPSTTSNSPTGGPSTPISGSLHDMDQDSDYSNNTPKRHKPKGIPKPMPPSREVPGSKLPPVDAVVLPETTNNNLDFSYCLEKVYSRMNELPWSQKGYKTIIGVDFRKIGCIEDMIVHGVRNKVSSDSSFEAKFKALDALRVIGVVIAEAPYNACSHKSVTRFNDHKKVTSAMLAIIEGMTPTEKKLVFTSDHWIADMAELQQKGIERDIDFQAASIIEACKSESDPAAPGKEALVVATEHV